MHPVLLPLEPQHLPPRQTPDEQEEEYEQEPPSEDLVVAVSTAVIAFIPSSQSRNEFHFNFKRLAWAKESKDDIIIQIQQIRIQSFPTLEWQELKTESVEQDED